MNDHNDLDDEPLLAGYAAMARCLTKHGFKTAKSTLSKIGAPSAKDELPAAERLPVEGYWGILPVANPTRLIEWARSRLSSSRRALSPVAASPQPASLAPVPPAPGPKGAATPTPPPPRKRGRPANVQPAGAAAEAPKADAAANLPDAILEGRIGVSQAPDITPSAEAPPGKARGSNVSATPVGANPTIKRRGGGRA
jgi:hypothetical protein